MRLLNKFIKIILSKLGWKMIKVMPPPKPIVDLPDGKLLDTMRECKGILHIGAHRGSEAPIYYWFGKNVIWFEANPRIYESLLDNIYPFKNQKAINCLLGDENEKVIDFHISNNDGASSSIFPFGKSHIDGSLFKDRKFKMVSKIKTKMVTLNSLQEKYEWDLKNFDHWVLDVQGAELLVLKGSGNLINFCKSIFIEISNVDAFEGGVLWPELDDWLKNNQFVSQWLPEDGHCNVLYLKK